MTTDTQRDVGPSPAARRWPAGLGCLVGLAMAVGCKRRSADNDEKPFPAEHQHEDDADPPAPELERPEPFAGASALAKPGRVLLVDIVGEPKGTVYTVAMDGSREPLPVEDAIYALPFARGQTVLGWTGRQVVTFDVAGGGSVTNDLRFDESLVAVSDGGRGGLFSELDLEHEGCRCVSVGEDTAVPGRRVDQPKR